MHIEKNENQKFLIGTCESCRYFKLGSGDVMGGCSCPKFFKDSPTISIILDDLVYWGPEGNIGFMVGKDFGCIHWKERNAHRKE